MAATGEAKMKRLFTALVAAAFGIGLAVALSPAPALAQSAGSGSAEVANRDIITFFTVNASSDVGSPSSGSSAAAMVANIKMSSASSKGLELSGSLETNLLTDTSVTGGSGKKTSSGTAAITVTPVITTPCDPSNLSACSQDICNGDLASAGVSAGPAVAPGTITYDARTQTLTADLGQICSESAGVVTCTGNESIDLLLSTMSAHTFNFLATGFSSGTYQVTMCIGASATASSDSVAPGTTVGVGVGPGSLIATVVQAETPSDSLDTSGATTFSF